MKLALRCVWCCGVVAELRGVLYVAVLWLSCTAFRMKRHGGVVAAGCFKGRWGTQCQVGVSEWGLMLFCLHC